MDSFDIEIPFTKSKAAIISLLQGKNISFDTPTKMQIVVKSKILSLDFDFFISLQFSGEKLTSIAMSPDITLEGDSLYSRYDEIQKALENELGHPHNCMRLIMKLMDPDSRSAHWQSDGIKIEHYLLN